MNIEIYKDGKRLNGFEGAITYITLSYADGTKAEVNANSGDITFISPAVMDPIENIALRSGNTKSPIYSRAEVLEEKWKPKYDTFILAPPIVREQCFAIDSDNLIFELLAGHGLYFKTMTYAPTRELAEEIIGGRIAKSKKEQVN